MKQDWGHQETRGLQAAQLNRFLGSRMHRPAVTLTFTLTG